MKLRTSFVTNSSSTCYLVTCTNKKDIAKQALIEEEQIKKLLANPEKYVVKDAFVAGTLGCTEFGWTDGDHYGVFTKLNWFAMQIMYQTIENIGDRFDGPKHKMGVLMAKETLTEEEMEQLVKVNTQLEKACERLFKKLDDLGKTFISVIKAKAEYCPFSKVDFGYMLRASQYFLDSYKEEELKKENYWSKIKLLSLLRTHYNVLYEEDLPSFSFDDVYIDHQSVHEGQLEDNIHDVLLDVAKGVETGNDNGN